MHIYIYMSLPLHVCNTHNRMGGHDRKKSSLNTGHRVLKSGHLSIICEELSQLVEKNKSRKLYDLTFSQNLNQKF